MEHQTHPVTTCIDVLRRIIAAPGMLCGYDLITGEEYSVVVPEDVEEFLAAHMLGPSKYPKTPVLDVSTIDGDHRRVSSLMRSMVMPYNEHGQSTHVAVRFKTKNSLSPSEEVVAASLGLRRAGIEHYLERSVIVGVWVLWIVMRKVVDRDHIQSLSHRVREIIRSLGIIGGHCTMPSLAEKPQALHLPSPFYSGSFLGVLFKVDAEGRMHEIEAGHHDEDVDAGPEAVTSSLDGLLERWVARHCSRIVRAGELMRFAQEEGVLPVPLKSMTSQAAAIALGRELLAMKDKERSRFQVTATRSGNSNVFRIEARECVEASTP